MYRLYLDEVGTDDLSHLETDNHRFLSLTGVVVHLGHVQEVLNPCVRRIKEDVFDYDPDENVHLHRSDITRRKSVFGQLNDNVKREKFDRLVLQMIENVDYKVVTVVLDKLCMTRQDHWQQQHPYHYLMEIMVEKYTQFLERGNDIGDIMPEARQGKKDRQLQISFDEVRANGTRFVSSDRIASKIRASKLKFRTKKDNVSGLQLCDLIAHPSHIYVRSLQGHDVSVGNFASSVIASLDRSKYDRSRRGRIEGYGRKFCP